MPFQFTCERCNKTFTRPQKPDARNPYRFCSLTCRFPVPFESDARRERWRRARGLCPYCGDPPAPGRKSCVRHLEAHRHAVKKCRKRNPGPTRQANKRYAERNSDVVRHRQKVYRDRVTKERVDAGLCVRCGKSGTPGAKGGRPLCEYHRQVVRTVYEKAYARRSRPMEIRLRAISVCGGACSECGFSLHPAALQFHHVAGEGKPLDDRGSQSTLMGRIARNGSQDDIVLLCANCHSIRHNGHLYEKFSGTNDAQPT